jgi:hypothetical protein
MNPSQPANSETRVGVINSLRGFMVEVEVFDEKPEERELLAVEGHPEVFLEVNYFKTNTAVCINLTNTLRHECFSQ